MARGSKSSAFMGLSALFYLVLLFAPLAFLGTVKADTTDAQEPLGENYGVGMYTPSTASALERQGQRPK